MIIWIISSLVAIAALAVAVVVIFMHSPRFGRLPQGERMERILRSPNYRDGQFCNLQPTPMFTSKDGSRTGAMLSFLFRRAEGLRPNSAVPAVKTDLFALPIDGDRIVWFGHSSYLLITGGKRILVDPVFCTAAPVAFANRPFEGATLYAPEDMPSIDYLIITHDHWDHLDYQTIVRLRNRIDRIVCPLGVGEHFERWGFAAEQLIEMDWNEVSDSGDGFRIHCLPARHFSGRGFKSNRTLWASYLVESPSLTVYMGGDGGYGMHFAEIGRQFSAIDLAILENGQYNDRWSNIHTMPDQLGSVARDLGARRVMTVHHSKYALARHPWNEPLENGQRLIHKDSLDVIVPTIGEAVDIRSKMSK